jgi:hypothetical protein
MAAGLGFKTFAVGEVLSAANVNGYLMQGVLVFANATARDAAITSPQEGQFAYLKDTNVTTYYTGSAWANLDTTGMTNPMTTTGDTIYSSSGSTPARLGIGSTGNVLTVAGGVPTWAAPAGGGGLTLISETIASSLSSLSFTSLGSYKQLLLMYFGILHSDNSTVFSIRFNNSSSTIYRVAGIQFKDTTGNSYAQNKNSLQTEAGGSQIYSWGDGANAPGNNDVTSVMGSVRIDNYTSSTKAKYIDAKVNYYANGLGQYHAYNLNSFFDSTTAITSIDVVRISGSGTFSNSGDSTIRLYGVN